MLLSSRAAATNHHKFGSLKTTEVYSFSSGSKKSEIKGLAGPCSLRRLSGESFLTDSSFGWLLVSLACGSTTPVLTSVVLHVSVLLLVSNLLFFSLVRIPAVGFRVHPKPRMILYQDAYLTIDTSVKPLFPNKVTFIGTGD